MLLPWEKTIYIDEYIPVTAKLEVITGEILKKIAGNPRLHALYFKTLEHFPSIVEKLAYALDFLVNIEERRAWVDNNLWWIV